MNQNILSLVKAMEFASKKHSMQRRKGAQAEPYINHPVEVANFLAEATQGEDSILLIAALLHDTIEDCNVSHTELELEFGSEVADLVSEVTDDKSLEKSERKRLQVVNASHKSPRAKMIKIADKTSNLLAILLSPPAGWDLDRKQEYFNWAESVIAGCRGINKHLEAKFDEALARLNELSK
jgi:(p)ppGpp synthase/HD superfamily hydrolase